MAQVKVTPHITETIERVIQEGKVVLTLSPNEARALHALTGAVSGSGIVRENTASVFQALDKAGVEDKGNAWYNAIKNKPHVESIAT